MADQEPKGGNAQDILHRELDNRVQLKQEIESGKKTWGRWTFKEASLWIEDYPIHADQLQNTDMLGNWMFQLLEKTWMTDADFGQFVRAVSDLSRTGILKFDRSHKQAIG